MEIEALINAWSSTSTNDIERFTERMRAIWLNFRGDEEVCHKKTHEFEGHVLKLGTMDKCRRKFAEDCKLDFAPRIPVAYNFDSSVSLIGMADISRDEDGLACQLTLFATNVLSDNEYFVGGYYTRVKSHVEDHITVIDSARLVSMSIVPEHGVADENLKVRRVEADAEN